jgi:hypothetical protein
VLVVGGCARGTPVAFVPSFVSDFGVEDVAVAGFRGSGVLVEAAVGIPTVADKGADIVGAPVVAAGAAGGSGLWAESEPAEEGVPLVPLDNAP